MIIWWKAIRLRSPEDLLRAKSYEEQVDALLLDAWAPIGLGGTGRQLPLEWLKKTNFNLPWWLAGGICAEWVPEVLNQTNPFGFDASSKIEISPGIKNMRLVNELINAVKTI